MYTFEQEWGSGSGLTRVLIEAKNVQKAKNIKKKNNIEAKKCNGKGLVKVE